MSDYQVSGVYSGIDWGDIIDETIENGRAIEEQWTDEQDDIDGKVTLYQELQQYLSDLEDSLDPLGLESTFLNKSADISVGTGSEGFLSVTATADADIAKYDVEVLSVAQNHTVAGSRVDDASAALGLSGDFSLSVGDFDVTVSVSSDDSLKDVVASINDAVNAKASEDEIEAPMSAKVMDNTLILSCNKTGKDYAIDTADTDGILRQLGVLDESGSFANELKTAKDAVLKVDGLEVTRSSNTIDDLIDGVTIDIAGEGTASVDVTLDAEEAVDSIKSMVEAYNATMDWINIRVSEKEDEDAEDGTVQTRWGLLHGDSMLWSTKQNMRYTVSKSYSSAVEGDYSTLSSIGVTTESDNYGESGELEFDESAFMDAMLKDPSSVKDLMNSFASGMKTFTESMISESTTTLGGTSSKKGSLINRIDSLEQSSDAIDDKIDDLEDRLALQKASLQKRYAAMETNLATLDQNAQYLDYFTSNYSNSDDD